MNKLFDIQNILLKQFNEKAFYWRHLFDEFTFDNQVCGLVGPRGVGKTTFLLQHAIKHGALDGQALYVSADNIYFINTSLFDLVDQLFKETTIRLLLIDEIHKYPGWEHQLKNCRDTYLDFKIIFTGSSQIDLVNGKFDLSRRVTLYNVHGFSFREYLEVNRKQTYPVLDFQECIENHVEIAGQISDSNILIDFNNYLRNGYYPFHLEFSRETENFQAIENITQKIIYEDIASCHSLKTASLQIIEKLYKFILNSSPGEHNASKLANTLGKDYTIISNYLNFLQQAGLIRTIVADKAGHAGLRTPAKIYPENSNLMFAAYLPIAEDNMRGKVRETFMINHCQNAALTIFHNDNGDFKIDNTTIEIGGRNKTAKQIKNIEHSYLIKDGIFTGAGHCIPLYLMGFLY